MNTFWSCGNPVTKLKTLAVVWTLFKTAIYVRCSQVLSIVAILEDSLTNIDELKNRVEMVTTLALHYTSQEKLNNELGWESIKQRIKTRLGSEVFSLESI